MSKKLYNPYDTQVILKLENSEESIVVQPKASVSLKDSTIDKNYLAAFPRIHIYEEEVIKPVPVVENKTEQVATKEVVVNTKVKGA